MSNVIKSGMVRFDNNDKKVINPFEQVDLQENNEEEIQETEEIKPLVTKDINSILKEKEQMLRDQEANLKVRYQNIIEVAENKADEIMEEARKLSKEVKEEAAITGQREGYEQGLARAAEEINIMKAELQAKEGKLEDEYNAKITKFERDFIGVFVSLCERMFGIIIDDKQEVLYHIINRTLLDTEKSNNYLIRVSSKDYEFINNKKQLLYDCVTEKANIDIVESETLTQNKCLIETDNSVIDCSVDTQIKNLMIELEMLSKL